MPDQERENYHAVDYALGEAYDNLESILNKNNVDYPPLSADQEREIDEWRSRIAEWRLSIDLRLTD